MTPRPDNGRTRNVGIQIKVADMMGCLEKFIEFVSDAPLLTVEADFLRIAEYTFVLDLGNNVSKYGKEQYIVNRSPLPQHLDLKSTNISNQNGIVGKVMK